MSSYMADLSNNNPHFDAAAYRKAGHRVIALKATEGVGGYQAIHGTRTAAAHADGVKVVHYHFAHPENHPDGRVEAREFWTHVKPHYRRGDRLCLDIEVNPGRTSIPAYVRAFVGELARLGHQHTWVYTYTSYAREHGVLTIVPAGCRLWLADYQKLSRTPAGLPRLWAHQFTDGRSGPQPHAMAGIGQCDVSRLSARARVALRLR